MTRQEATEFLEKMKKMYGKRYVEELARRTGCNPDNYDDYGLVYCMQFNTMSRKFAAARARSMKGHGQDLFDSGPLFKNESRRSTTKKVRLTEGDLRNIITKSVKRVLREMSGGSEMDYDSDQEFREWLNDPKHYGAYRWFDELPNWKKRNIYQRYLETMAEENFEEGMRVGGKQGFRNKKGEIEWHGEGTINGWPSENSRWTKG